MRTTVVTGSAGGMGVAIRKHLEGLGEKVIGVDVRDAEVVADLSSDAGRLAMVEEVEQLCGGKLDGVVAAAGLCNDVPPDLITSVNYFGAVATLDGLRPMLARGDAPRAVGISSHSMVIVPIIKRLMDLYQADDEAGARALSIELGSEDTGQVYATSKYALACWIREQAIRPEWIGSGIALNAVAPGLIRTPMNTPEHEAAVLALGDEIYPVPAGRPGTADEIAGLVGYLLSSGAGYMCGTVINIDGGTEPALRRGDSPAPRAWV